jgi:exonuclease SbcC
MIRRITLTNFMSHKETVIEPAEGLTVLAGQNNCGKSAVVSALQILAGNASGDFMVRHGERECVVKVETSEGHVIEWRRLGGTVSYGLNGQDVHRLRGNVPDGLQELLRLPMVEAEGGDFDIHFGEQKRPIFLLNEPGSRRALFFASSSDARKLIEMQNLHRRKTQEARIKEAELAKRDEKVSSRLAALNPLETLREQVRQLEENHQKITHREQAVAQLGQMAQQIERAANLVSSWTHVTKSLAGLLSPPELTDIGPIKELIKSAQELEAKVALGGDLDVILRRLNAPPTLEDPVPLVDIIRGMKASRGDIGTNNALRAGLSDLQSPPELCSTSSRAEMVEKLEEAENTRTRCREFHTSLRVLRLPPPVHDTDGMQLKIQKLQYASKQRKREKSMSRVLAACGEPPTLEDTSLVQLQIEAQSMAASAVSRAGSVCECLSLLVSPPTLTNVNDLSSLVARSNEEQGVVKERELEVQGIRADLAELEHEIVHCAEELGACPVCGQEVDTEKLILSSTLAAGANNDEV